MKVRDENGYIVGEGERISPQRQALEAALGLNSRSLHWRDGWYFIRASDGAVVIEKHPKGRIEAVPEIAVQIPPGEWASIVASVSAQGETAETYQQILAFHGSPEKEL